MRRLRMLVLALVMAAGSLMAAPSANAFCGVEDGCSPCTFDVVVSGKNSSVNFHHC